MKGKVKGNKEERSPGCCASRHHLTLFTYYYERKLGDSCTSWLKDKNVLRIKRGKKILHWWPLAFGALKPPLRIKKKLLHILFVYNDLRCILRLPIILCAHSIDIPRMKRHYMFRVVEI